MKWIKLEDEKPKYTQDYLCACIIGSMFGSSKEVRCYKYEKIRGIEPKWCIPNNYHEIVNIEFWCDMPDYPEIEEA